MPRSRSRSADTANTFGSGYSSALGARSSRSNLRPNSFGDWESGSFAGSRRNSYAGSRRTSIAGSSRGMPPAPLEVLGHMDDIVTYWGAYNTLARVVASPFYARVEIPVNPRHFEQWRNDVFSPPSLYHAMLPEVLSKATFTLHAVHPVPIRYLAQMSSLHLEYLARSMYDDQYEERNNTPKGDASDNDHVERLKRTYTTFGRISLIYETRFDERVEDSLSLQNMSDAIERMLTAFEKDLERIEWGEVGGRGSMDAPLPPPPHSHLGSRSQSPGVHRQFGNMDAPLDPRTRGKGFRAFFQRDRASPSAEDSNSPRVQAPSTPQSLLSTSGLITMTISPKDMSAFRHVIESGQLAEAALHVIQSIVANNQSSLKPETRLVEDEQMTEAAVHAIENIGRDNTSRPVSPKSRVGHR
ncbi:hypothetical protein PMIN01_05122 [Paraphaeosphaeria minitans]|uniref:Uncharacterized protein n=1 Tax=Paraphaeosphaeria minitans TaxID=565426 RepID=A0A9P6GL38_9PLEO|nr:hypothetical protein PMIN01_05122 [Paraphaeosphaeria minitans]